MFNPTSQMNQGQDGNFQNTYTNKKLPNPANFKIVKCKNFERGIFNDKKFKTITIFTLLIRIKIPIFILALFHCDIF